MIKSDFNSVNVCSNLGLITFLSEMFKFVADSPV